jgi:hypothetical protein
VTRLYNHTRHPDKSIRGILAFSTRVIGVKGDVCVKVTRFVETSGVRFADSSDFCFRGQRF